MGSIRVLLPVAQGRADRGRLPRRRGRLARAAADRAPSLNQGLVGARRPVACSGSGGKQQPALITCSAAAPGPATASLDVGAPARDRRLLAGRRQGRRDHAVRNWPGKHMGRTDRHSAGAATLRWSSRSHNLRPDPNLTVGSTVRRDHLQGRDDHRLRPGRAPGPRARDHRRGEPRVDRDPRPPRSHSPENPLHRRRLRHRRPEGGRGGGLPGLEGGAGASAFASSTAEKRRPTAPGSRRAPRRAAAGLPGADVITLGKPRLAPPRDRALPRDGRSASSVPRTWPRARQGARAGRGRRGGRNAGFAVLNLQGRALHGHADQPVRGRGRPSSRRRARRRRSWLVDFHAEANE